jgi:hypothetical protein
VPEILAGIGLVFLGTFLGTLSGREWAPSRRQKGLRGISGLLAAIFLVGAFVTALWPKSESPVIAEVPSLPPLILAGSTQIHLYQPVTEQGLAPGVRIQEAQDGYCWLGSVVDQYRSDAWRCAHRDTILDPCFSEPFGFKAVLCAHDPWSALLVRLTGVRLPRDKQNQGEPPGPLPWAVELGDGERCVMQSGATSVTADRRWNYLCDTGAWLLGEMEISSQGWRAYYSRPTVTADVKQVEVADVWF